MAHRVCWKCKTNGNHLLHSSQDSESLCERCLVWGTLAALLHHGPIANTPSILRRRNGRQAPPLSAYPIDWQSAYRQSQPAFEEAMRLALPTTDYGKMVADACYQLRVE